MRVSRIVALATFLPLLLTAESWRGLEIAEENRCSEYRALDYSYSRAVEAQIVARQGNRIYSPYDGTYFASTFETDIEHVVARSEAHDSGLCSASEERKREFANDLDNLTLASPALNRRYKGGRDAGEWLPQSNRCWYAATIVAVKLKYGLTVDVIEAGALEQVLGNCPRVEMQFSDPATP